MVLCRIVLEIVRSIGLVAETEVVDELDSALPVSDERIAWTRTMDLILTSSEVPHEVAPVHPVHLVVKEECQILEECRLVVLCTTHLMSAATHIRLIK